MLRIDGAATLANVISGFAPGDVIDLAGLAFSAAEHVFYNGSNELSVTTGGGGVGSGNVLAEFTVSGLTVGTPFLKADSANPGA